MVKTYSATAFSLSCRVKSPVFSLGTGVGILGIGSRLCAGIGGISPCGGAGGGSGIGGISPGGGAGRGAGGCTGIGDISPGGGAGIGDICPDGGVGILGI